VHATAVPQLPLAVHVSTPLPEQMVCPGAHTPVHVPPTHVWLTQAVPAVQLPLVLQVWGWLDDEQLVCPGAHAPVHAPLTQVWLVQAVGEPQAPLDVHDSTPLPEQVVCPGAQAPVQTPLIHV
jgi:hypothetical protein